MTTKFQRQLRENLTAWTFLAPAFLVLLVFWFIPVILALFFSFTDIRQGDRIFAFNSGGPGGYAWVGLENYERLMSPGSQGGDREIFLKTFYNSINYVAYSVPLTLVLSLGLALLLNQKLRGMHFYRTVFFLPHITTWVAIALVWKQFYNEHFGVANYLGQYLFGMPKLAWLNEPRGVVEMLLSGVGITFSEPLHPLIAGPSLAMFGIVLTNVWYDVGYFVIIFLAGLQNIDASNYEAAEIDGANPVQKFFYITVPLLSPVIFFLLIISLINAFKEFIPMLIMTPTGGPGGSTTTLVFFMFEKAFGSGSELGYGAAIAFVILLIILMVTLLQKVIIGRKVHYS